jgi:uncharacterized protein (DUF302 family)
MKQTTSFAVDHVVVQSNRSYEEVKATLEVRMGTLSDTDTLARELSAMHAPWDKIVAAIEQRLGRSGFAIFSKVEQGQLLSLAGKPGKAVQYAVGNPLLAIQMIEHAPEVALYAPLRLAVYETHDGKTFVTFDRLSSYLAQYARPEIARVAKLVDEKVEALVTEATGTEANLKV